jgi:hypothetical protein
MALRPDRISGRGQALSQSWQRAGKKGFETMDGKKKITLPGGLLS